LKASESPGTPPLPIIIGNANEALNYRLERFLFRSLGFKNYSQGNQMQRGKPSTGALLSIPQSVAKMAA
jgi:hypothetical protein